jgi:cytochrome c553
MRTIMETFYLVNQVGKEISTIDPVKFPTLSAGLLDNMGTDARMFLDDTLWNGKLTDLLLSRTAYVNTHLAKDIYNINPIPSGATETNFVKVTLPSDQRAGILTNAAFITRSARPDKGSVVIRGLAVRATMLCVTTPGPPDNLTAAVAAARTNLDTQSVQQQVASRKSGTCAACHGNFDAYGLVQDYYDNLGVYRTMDDQGNKVDAHTTLPDFIGGGTAQNTIDLANAMSKSPAFTNCMSTSILQYALTDLSAPVELPLMPSQAGCAAADVAQRFQSSSNKTFTDLVNATAAAPGFVLRTADTSAYP